MIYNKEKKFYLSKGSVTNKVIEELFSDIKLSIIPIFKMRMFKIVKQVL
jgi:hypothetical protein